MDVTKCLHQSARQDRLLFGMVRRGWGRSASLRDEWRNDLERTVCRLTVNWRLLERGYQARRPIKKPKLTASHKGLCPHFARQHRNLTIHHWPHVVFGDESRFLLHRVDGWDRVRRLREEALRNDCVMSNQTGGGDSVHVWGAFHHGGASDLVVPDRNVTGVLYRDILDQNLTIWFHSLDSTFRTIYAIRTIMLLPTVRGLCEISWNRSRSRPYTSLYSDLIATTLNICGMLCREL